MQQFLKFGALSGGGWLLDSTILLVLFHIFNVFLPIANFLSSSIAAVTVFTASRFLVFDVSTEKSGVKTLIYFFYTSGVIVVASILIGPVVWLAKYVTGYLSFDISSAQAAFIGKVIITPPQLLANFMMSRYLSQKN